MNNPSKSTNQGKIPVRKKQDKVVIQDRCKGCGFCVAFCPRGILRFSGKSNRKGYHFPELTDHSQCVVCQFCEDLCPEFAIYSVENRHHGMERPEGETL